MKPAARILLTAVATFAILAVSRLAIAQTVDCEAARCAVQAALDQSCSCDASTNHGRYVSCVARTLQQLWRAGAIPTRCRGRAVSCAARSTCGRDGAATCVLTRTGMCDTATGTCRIGTAAGGSCAADADCSLTRCVTLSSDQRCFDMGGVPGRGSCCAGCGP
jgi:hypothetical protein